MPLLNPGIVARSPFLSDTFWLSHAEDTVNSKGRATLQYGSSTQERGIITQAGKGDLERLTEAQRAENVINVVTNCEVRGPTPGAQPDKITWAGTDYLVIKCLPYPRFGIGWYKVLASSQNAIDLMPSKTHDY